MLDERNTRLASIERRQSMLDEQNHLVFLLMFRAFTFLRDDPTGGADVGRDKWC
jgi:hypothetical protein